MSDVFGQEKRSVIMSHIRSTGTLAEKAVFAWLKQHRYKFKTHVKELPGKPDVVLERYKTVIFIHGCFWHHHPGCSRATLPKTRKKYWLPKIEKNIKRDRKHSAKLRRMGWHVYTVWECQIKKDLEKAMKRIQNRLRLLI